MRVPHRMQVSVSHQGYELLTDPSSCAVKEKLQVLSTSAPSTTSSTSLLPALDPLNLSMSLVGPHQHDNLAAAVTALRVLRRDGWSIPDVALQRGLESASLAGRFQVRLVHHGLWDYIVHGRYSASLYRDSAAIAGQHCAVTHERGSMGHTLLLH